LQGPCFFGIDLPILFDRAMPTWCTTKSAE
jgi:hypothetical protein